MEYEEPSNIRMQKAAARFLLTLKEQHRPTQVAINFLVAQVKQVVYCVIEDVRAYVEQALLDNSTGLLLINCNSWINVIKALTPLSAWKLSTNKPSSTKPTSILWYVNICDRIWKNPLHGIFC